MHRTRLAKIIILIAIGVCLFPSDTFSQTTRSGEVDVTKCWSYKTGETVGTELASDGARVFLGLEGGKVEALSLDGKKMWATELGGDVASNILPLDGGVFLVTSTVSSGEGKPGDNVLRSLSKATGITNWTLNLPDAEKYFLGRFGGALIVVSKSGTILAIDAKSGAARWKREIAEGFVAEPAFNGSKVIVATSAKQIFIVLLTSGEIDSVRKMPFVVTALGGRTDGGLIVGDDRGNISSLNGTDKPAWGFKSGGEVSSVFAIGNHVLATSHDNFVYFLSARNGGRSWKKRMSGRVSRIANVLDRFALVSSFEEHGAVVTDLSNGKVAGQIAFTDNESLVSSPIASNGLIFVLTNEAAYSYSLSGCLPK